MVWQSWRGGRLLPWATYRTPPWNHGEVVLDPWTRLLSRPLIWNDGTQVGDVALTPDDPRARALAGAIGRLQVYLGAVLELVRPVDHHQIPG